MKYISKSMAAIALGLASVNVCAADYDFKPGLWEMVTVVEGTQEPPKKEQACVKGIDANGFFEVVGKENKQDPGCEYNADSTLKCIPVKRPAPPCDFASKPPVF